MINPRTNMNKPVIRTTRKICSSQFTKRKAARPQGLSASYCAGLTIIHLLTQATWPKATRLRFFQGTTHQPDFCSHKILWLVVLTCFNHLKKKKSQLG